jgi:hypothetical protein
MNLQAGKRLRKVLGYVHLSASIFVERLLCHEKGLKGDDF